MTATQQVKAWREQWRAMANETHWGDNIDWRSAEEIARRLDEIPTEIQEASLDLGTAPPMIDALREALVKRTSMTVTSGPGKRPYIQINFQNLTDTYVAQSELAAVLRGERDLSSMDFQDLSDEIRRRGWRLIPGAYAKMIENGFAKGWWPVLPSQNEEEAK